MRSATGKEYDIRKVAPYARYDKVEFDVPTATYSDALTRVRFKWIEMHQIIRIIRQVLDMMPEGKVREKGLDGSALRWQVPKDRFIPQLRQAAVNTVIIPYPTEVLILTGWLCEEHHSRKGFLE